MTPFLWNILMALTWAAARGDLTLLNLVVGAVLGYMLLWLTGDLLGASHYCARLPRILDFVIFFIWELLLANVRVAWDVITPIHSMRPGIIAVPLDMKSDEQITMLANVISLTPGSLCLDISQDRKRLFVHVQNLTDADKERRRLKQGFERRILELLK